MPRRDPLSEAQRSENMRRIRARNTRPELQVRKALHALGFRFLLHDKRLPGKPDIVLPRWRCIIFVHGCFWHGHDCSLGAKPATNAQFWAEKISANRRRDGVQAAELHRLGWRIATVWECSLKGRNRLGPDQVAHEIAGWLRSGATEIILREKNPD
jgi:DNA mismatch endonuclease, patch repair protein